MRVAPDGFSFAEGGGYACNECRLVLKGVGGCKKHAGTEKCRTKAETRKRKVSLLRARLRPASRTLRAGGQAAAGTQARQGVFCGGGCGGGGCGRGGRRQRHGASARLSLATQEQGRRLGPSAFEGAAVVTLQGALVLGGHSARSERRAAGARRAPCLGALVYPEVLVPVELSVAAQRELDALRLAALRGNAVQLRRGLSAQAAPPAPCASPACA